MTEKNKEYKVSQNLITIKGILTSAIQLRGENTSEPYYYSFIKLKGQSVDLPVIFKIKGDQEQLIKPPLKKFDEIELEGNYSNSSNNVRKSFTCLDYCRLVITKKCIGCCDKFTCSSQKNFDYCSNCEVNNSRYVSREDKCSECDGSGLIKFPNQPIRGCKLCFLAHQEKREEKNIFAK